MEITPVDAEIVARTVKDALIARADIQQGQAAGARPAPGDGFIVGVDGNDGVYVQEKGNVVAALAAGSKTQICDGTGQHIEIFGKRRRKESNGQVHLAGVELVDGM